MAKFYCAGPLFSEGERYEMAAIAHAIESAGHHNTYLPQRDGLEAPELAKKLGREGIHLHHLAIFSLDVYYLLEWCDVVIANLNGRVPDEGTVVECALAWHAKKPLIIYKNDDRTAPFDGFENPMITGLTGCFVNTIDDLVGCIKNEHWADHSTPIRTTIDFGRAINQARKECNSVDEFGAAIIRLAQSLKLNSLLSPR